MPRLTEWPNFRPSQKVSTQMHSARDDPSAFSIKHFTSKVQGKINCTLSIATRHRLFCLKWMQVLKCLDRPALFHDRKFTDSQSSSQWKNHHWTKPTVWWLAVKRSQAVCKDRCEIAKKLLVMPASSGRTERVFSNFGLVQTKLCNRLGVEKAANVCVRFQNAPS